MENDIFIENEENIDNDHTPPKKKKINATLNAKI